MSRSEPIHRRSPLPILALVAAAAAAGIANAAVRETVTVQNVPSAALQGEPGNAVVSFTLAGGYAMGTLHIVGIYTGPVIGTRPDHCAARVRRPDGLYSTLRLSDVNSPVATGTTLVSAALDFDGIDPAGAWELEFYETIDNAADAPDMIWQSLTLEFEDESGGANGADVTLCALYGLQQWGREGDVVGMSAATTSWNIGSRDLIWREAPDSRHPFIITNVYRLRSGRFEQVGMSWVKHGLFAFSNSQCGGFCNRTSGEFLGVGCTDTYSSGLNALQSGLGPRFEVNAWSGDFAYSGSVLESGLSDDSVTRLIQLHDADIDPLQNPGAAYFVETYYLCREDTDVMNSAAWKPVSFVGAPGIDWMAGMSGAAVAPTIGFALDAWTGSAKTTLSQQSPALRGEAPDGRCVLAWQVTDVDGGAPGPLWHYEYALLNIDMDRQVGSFSVALPAGVSVSNIGFGGARHHEEAFNYPPSLGGVPIDNAAWNAVISGGHLTWSTSTNPLRWGMLDNFHFDANQPPAPAGVELGLFRPGTPGVVNGVAEAPAAPLPDPCLDIATGDANCDGSINNFDIGPFVEGVLNFTDEGPPGAFVAQVGAGANACWAARRCWGDLNCDGSLNNFDIDAFVTCIISLPAGGCPCEPQACCWTNGACANLRPAACLRAGGIVRGAGTSCASVACP